MAKGAKIKLPKVPTHTALYAKKVDVKTMDKINKIVEKLDVSKWSVIDKLLSEALGIKTNNPLDLSKFTKVKK